MKTLILSSGDEMYINSGSTDLLMYIPASTAAREKKDNRNNQIKRPILIYH